MRHSPGLVVNLVAKAGGIDNGERDAGAFLFKLWGSGSAIGPGGGSGDVDRARTGVERRTDGDGLDLDALFDVGR